MSTEDLRHGGCSEVPGDVALCPECDSLLWVESTEWDTETGVPTRGGLTLECVSENERLEARMKEGTELDDDPGHRWSQSDWQPVMDAVARWCEAEEA